MKIKKENITPGYEFIIKAVANDNNKFGNEIKLIYSQIGDQRAFDLAKINLVEPIVAHSLINVIDEESLPSHWQHSHNESFQRISAYLSELDRVTAILAENNIPLIALKNGGIARGIYHCIGCNPMGDLDVLVDKKHFKDAHHILLSEGYHFEFRSPLENAELEEAEKLGGAEYWKTLPSGENLWFELQWRAVAGKWIRPDQEPTAEELISRSIPISGTAVRLLSPEDNLLQVSLHTAKHSYIRHPGFRLNLDVDRIVRSQQVDWDIFVKRVLNFKVKTPVYFSLAIPKALFDTPIPDNVLNMLKPSVLKEEIISRWLQKADLFNPDAPKFGRIGYIIFTIMLYDDWTGLFKGIFPEGNWMRKQYKFKNKFLLPYYYIYRLASLIFKRLKT